MAIEREESLRNKESDEISDRERESKWSVASYLITHHSYINVDFKRLLRFNLFFEFLIIKCLKPSTLPCGITNSLQETICYY